MPQCIIVIIIIISSSSHSSSSGREFFWYAKTTRLLKYSPLVHTLSVGEEQILAKQR
jgi:hypothetical protein